MILVKDSNPPEGNNALLFARMEKVNNGNYQWRLFEVELDKLIKKDRGIITLPTYNIKLRHTKDLNRIAYENADSLGSWIEIKNLREENSPIKKIYYHTVNDSTLIDDFYWYSRDTLLIELSELTFKESINEPVLFSDSNYIDNRNYVPVKVKSKLFFYDIKDNSADTLLELEPDLSLLPNSNNRNGIYFRFNKGVNKYMIEEKEIEAVGDYRHFDPHFKYAVVRPNSQIFTHFVNLETKDSVLVPEYNDEFFKKLKVTEIDSYSFRYYMDFINWDGDNGYYTFSPISEPKVFVGLDENYYSIFRYNMKEGKSKVVFRITLREFFESRFYPELVNDNFMIARKFENGQWQCYKYTFKNRKEEKILDFQFQRLRVFNDRN